MFVEQGQRLPRFYGVSYIHFDRMGVEAHPVPLNMLIAVGRTIWILVKAKIGVSLSLWVSKYEKKNEN